MQTPPTVGDYIDIFLREVRTLVSLGERKPTTLEGYTHRAKHQLAPLRSRPIADLGIDEVRAWHLAAAERVRESGGHGKTTGTTSANLALRMLRLVLRRAEMAGVIPRGSSPTQYITRFQERPRDRYLTENETAALWEAIGRLEAKVVRHAKRPKALAHSPFQAFRLIILLALRRNEALFLRWDQVNLDDRVLLVPSKTGLREVALSEEAVKILREQLRRRVSEWVFPSRAHGKPVQHVYTLWRRILEVSCIDPRGVVLHTARHSLATCSIRRGEPIENVSLLLGHSSSKVTRGVYSRPLATPGMRALVERQAASVTRRSAA